MSQLDNFHQLAQALSHSIIGQETLINRMLIALLADGHLLVEGAPGLAKTRAISELSKLIEGDFQRIQFTPDLLPGDVTGTEVFLPQEGSFTFQNGPIFHNLVLADEINRAPAKVQSALLEAMAERQISVGSKTHKLPQLFMVMATQNPIEQEGTFPLPEAQLDRFLMHVSVDYPSDESEHEILKLTRRESRSIKSPDQQKPTVTTISQQAIFSARDEVLDTHMADSIETYIVKIISATRNASDYGQDLANNIEYGASPRGTIALDRCARAHAWLDNRDFVTPEDVQAVAANVLRHRIGVSYQAEAQGVDGENIVSQVLDLVPCP